MLNLSITEWLIIIAVALLLFGANKLPQLGRSVGQFFQELKKSVSVVQDEDKKD